MSSPEGLEIITGPMLHFLDVKNDVLVLVEKLKRGSLVHWNEFSDLLNDLLTTFKIVKIEENSQNCTMLNLFEIHKCSDISVIAVVLDLMCSIECDLILVNQLSFWRTSRSRENRDISLPMFENHLIFAYKNNSSSAIITSEFCSIHPNFNWVSILAYYGEIRLLEVMTSFGSTVYVPEDISSTREWNTFYADILMKLPKTRITDQNELLRFEEAIKDNLKSKFDKGLRMRLYFIFVVLNIYRKLDIKITNENKLVYIQCVRLLITSTPEPFITYEEIKRVITKLGSGFVSNEKILQLLKNYEKYFPESSEFSTPRSLQHLSRFQVRENLRTARTYPYGVASLPIPKKIQDYLRLKDMLSVI